MDGGGVAVVAADLEHVIRLSSRRGQKKKKEKRGEKLLPRGSIDTRKIQCYSYVSVGLSSFRQNKTIIENYNYFWRTQSRFAVETRECTIVL